MPTANAFAASEVEEATPLQSERRLEKLARPVATEFPGESRG